MNIERNARVLATDGEVGHVTHVIVDPATREVMNLVVRQDDKEWIVPVDAVAVADGGQVRLRGDRASVYGGVFDRDQFSAVDEKRARDESDRQAEHGGAALLDAGDNTVQIGDVPAATAVASPARAEHRSPTTLDDGAPYHLQLREERLRVTKQLEQSGGVRVTRRVVERIESLTVPLREEWAVIERLPGSGPVILDGRELGEGEQVEIVVCRERAIVKKEMEICEDVIVRKERRERVEQVRETVRREELTVEASQPDLVAPANGSAAQPNRLAEPDSTAMTSTRSEVR